MVIHSILKPSVKEAGKPYMHRIIIRGGKVDRLIDTEIIPLLSDGQLVSDSFNAESHPPPSRSERHAVPEEGVEAEQIY